MAISIYLRKAGTNPHYSLLEGGTINVKVGPQKADFFVHERLVCHYSSFFKGAVQGNFKEASTKVVTLETDTPDDFEHFYRWLYTGSICEKCKAQLPPRSSDSKVQDHASRMWIFGDKYGVPGLQNKAIDTWHHWAYTTNVPGLTNVWAIYNKTRAGSKIRALFVLFGAVRHPWITPTNTAICEGMYPASFLWDVIQKLRDLYRTRDTGVQDKALYFALTNLNLCDYHEHKEGEDCSMLGGAVPLV